MATQASIDAVQKLYVAFYQRPADVTGLEYWANRVDAAGGDTSAVVNAFATSAEATATYGSLNTNQLVNKIYSDLFGRAPDAAGLNFYSNAIAAGTMTPGKLAQNILDGATGTDATIIANKLTVAKAYTAAMDTTTEILAYSNATAQTNAKNLLLQVNALDSSVTNATNQIPAVMVSNVNNAAANIAAAGTTFTFTASPLDAATNVGSASADVAAGHILGNETVTGTAGSADKLTFTTATGAAGFNFNTGGAVAGGNALAGFEQLVLANGTNNITMKANIVGTATAGSYNVITGGTGYDTITTTAATSTAPNVAATTTNTVNMTTVTGIEQFNVTANSNGTDGTADATANLTFSGAAASGYVSATVVGAAGAVAGNDGIVNITVGNFVGNNITVGTTITAGGAGAETVNVIGGNQSDTLSVTGGSAVTTNFETVNSAAGSTVTLNGTAAGGVATQVVNVTGGANVVLGANNATVNLATAAASAGADVITLNAANTVNALVAGSSVATVNGFNAAAADTIKFGVATTAVYSVTLGSVTSNFIADVNAALANNAAYKAGAGTANNAIIVNVGADAYVIKETALSALTGSVAATDLVVKLVGYSGAFDTTDFVA